MMHQGIRIRSLCMLVIVSVAGSVAAAKKKSPQGWLRSGGLGPKPERVTDALPLSDQDNQGKWQKYEPMTDEFDGTELDPAKWHPTNPRWLGRQPAFFYKGNVNISDGNLHLTMRKGEVPEMPKDKGYHTYTSAAVQSKTRVKYGYFEIKAKPMKSHGSSSFWFYDNTPELWTEIDVFEIGGGAPGFERKYNMNVHVFRTPTEKRHWSVHGAWMAPSDLADDYHVYGLEWNREKIRCYFDGVIVRWIENTHWHQPLTLNFDSETMPKWFGLPRDSDLPSTYSIEYVRAWKKRDVAAKPVFLDTRFQQGFLLSYPDTSRDRATKAVLNLGNPSNKPIWRLCQWGTKHSLADVSLSRDRNRDASYFNEAKMVFVGGANSEKRDLILQINGRAEYGQHVRKYGQSWPHLLVEQDANEIHNLTKLKGLQFKLSLKLLGCKNHMRREDYDPQLHAAQFQAFFIVRNMNKRLGDFGNYFWFGVPFFDSRYDIPPQHTARDAGKSDATGKFIYTIADNEINNTPLKEGQWVTVQKDLLPYIKDGLKETARKGHLASCNPADYAVVNMNLGWEIPGTFDASMQIKDLEVLAVLE
jgi:beta-glucanase (GH16 family)